MKIQSNPKIIPAVDPQQKKTKIDPTQKSFGQILSETVKSDVAAGNKVDGSLPMSGLTPLQLELNKNNIDRIGIVSKLEQLLDVLDQYRMNLENPQVSLKEIAPLTRDLDTKLQELVPELDKLDQKDPLAPILNETLIATTLEVKKFENGWYNPT